MTQQLLMAKELLHLTRLILSIKAAAFKSIIIETTASFVLFIGERSLHATIEEKLYEKLLSLPRIMRSSNDDQKVHVLNVLLGLFNLLGHKLADILNSLSLLEKLLKSFIQVR